MKQILLRIIIILLILAVIGLYVYEIVFKQIPPTENLIRTLSIILGAVAALLKLQGPSSRRSLAFYEGEYQDKIQGAFAASPRNRKKLLTAIRLYNENHLKKAIKKLQSLQHKCQEYSDFAAVGLFLALSYTDLSLYKNAIAVYEQLIAMNAVTPSIYGNLGRLYMRQGNNSAAMNCYEKAIFLNPQHSFSYHNMASLYFDTYDLDKTLEYAHKALALNPKLYQAASLLAIVYSLQNNPEESNKYFHIAITNGEGPEKLKNAIAFYHSRQEETYSEE